MGNVEETVVPICWVPKDSIKLHKCLAHNKLSKARGYSSTRAGVDFRDGLVPHVHFTTKKKQELREMRRCAQGLGLFLNFPVLTRMNTVTEIKREFCAFSGVTRLPEPRMPNPSTQ